MDDLIDKLMAAGRRFYAEYYPPWDQWLVVADDLVGQVAQFDWESAAQAEADRRNRKAMRAVLEPLVGALRPFADEAKRRDHLAPGPDIDHWPIGGNGLTYGDLRHARAALATLTGETTHDR